MILEQSQKILIKFDSTHKFGTTVIMPSTSELNELFLEQYKQINSNIKLVSGVIEKMTAQEVFDAVTQEDSLFYKTYNSGNKGKINYKKAVDELKQFIQIMNIRHKGLFSYHAISNHKMRNLIQKTLKLCDNPAGKYGDMINGKDILILDDSISSGATLRQAISLIKSAFTPKSITVLTMFSQI